MSWNTPRHLRKARNKKPKMPPNTIINPSKFKPETKLKVFTAFVVSIIFGLVSFFYFAVTKIY